MESTLYKTYELGEVLELYLNKNGSLILLEKKENEAAENTGSIKSYDIDILDMQIEKDFLDDFDVPKNETVIERNNRIKRYKKIVKLLKLKYEYKCQICNYSFLMNNGNNYCEAHHIKMLSKDGKQSPENVIILCANHHRMFHYASERIIIGDLVNGKRTIKIGGKDFDVLF